MGTKNPTGITVGYQSGTSGDEVLDRGICFLFLLTGDA
jgi:hypothetical protein